MFLFIYVYISSNFVCRFTSAIEFFIYGRRIKMKNNQLFTMELMVSNSHLFNLDCNQIYVLLKCQCLSRFNSYSHKFYFDKTILKSITPKILHNKIDSSLRVLVHNDILQKYGNTHYIFDYDLYKLMCDTYTLIYTWEFDKIEKPEILYHYLHILKSRNGSLNIYGNYGKVSTMPITYFSEIENISDHSISRYNKHLEDLNILYVCHHSYSNARENNIYSRLEDAKYAEALKGEKKKESKESNFLRSVQQRINHIHVDTDMDQLLRDCIRYNSIMEKRGEKRRIDLTQFS